MLWFPCVSSSYQPYSPACRLAPASNVQELASMEGRGRIVLLDGELTCEQLLPKHFPFLQWEEHGEIIVLLEQRGFAAVLAATDTDPNLAGRMSPFPLLEDGDFSLPSAYMTLQEGERLPPKWERPYN